MKSIRLIAVVLGLAVLSRCGGGLDTLGTLSFSPQSGPIGTLVSISGTDFSTLQPRSLAIGGVSPLLLSSSASSLLAFVMPGAVSGPIGLSTANGSYSGPGGFTVTATGVPVNQQGGKLIGSGEIGNGFQGISAAISADGNTAVVGASHDNALVGAVWVFTRTAGVWTQQGAKLFGSDSVGTVEQGCSVAISADGNTLVFGGSADNSNAGAVWVFTRSAGVWTQQGAKLIGTGAVGAVQQGGAVAISADGNTLVEGGLFDNSSAGAVWVFTRSAGVWTQQGGKLVGSGAIGGAQQGLSVALSADGNTLLSGANADNSLAGAAWVFTRSGGVWTQQGAKLVGTGAIGNAQQGYSTALSADGSTAIVGGVADNADAGAAWVFVRSAGAWAQQGAKLVGGGAVGAASFANSVAVTADGNLALIGGEQDNSSAGAGWLFARAGGVWSQQGTKLLGSGGTGAGQFSAVSLSADGKTAIDGGPNDNSNAGAFWIFTP